MARQTMRPHRDPRFEKLGTQPRAGKLDRKQRNLAQQDATYAEALRHRVTDQDRYRAFMESKTTYLSPDNPCAKCSGVRRTVRDAGCHTCLLERVAEGFARLKAQRKVATEKSNGHTDSRDAGTPRPAAEVSTRGLFEEIFPGH